MQRRGWSLARRGGLGAALVAMALALPLAAQESRRHVGTSAAEERELKDLELQWEKALETGDVETVDRMLASDMIYTQADGARHSKKEDLEIMSSGKVDISEMMTDEDVKVRLLEDNVAVVIGGHTEKSKFEGRDTSGRYRWTEVWVKRDGRWQVVAGQIGKIPEDME